MLRAIKAILGLTLFLALAGLAVVLLAVNHYGADLPDYKKLAAYEPPVVTRVHAGDGRLLTQFAVEERVFVPIEAIPKRVINAFLSAEDKTFYSHPGVDIPGVIQAIITNVANLGKNRRPIGASTITQQVAKNFLLTSEVSLERKIKEAILAFRIEQTYSKDRILELYLNEIYLGGGAYGVAAAALRYFNKSLDELTIAEAAYLGALPKAPNNYHPVHNAEAAIGRRNWVIGRMVEDGHITRAEAEKAMAEPLVMRETESADSFTAAYFAEEVRRRLVERFGADQLYGGGLSVRTTLDPRLQQIAEQVLRDGLMAYDRRHGWRGPIARIETGPDWVERLAAVERPRGLLNWQLAVVLAVEPNGARIGLPDGSEGWIPLEELTWARPWMEGQYLGPEVRRASDVLRTGDVVAVEAVTAEGTGDGANPPGSFALRQIPAVSGALVALDPHTGRVLAMTGGWSYERSEFNRAIQAMRQPGSAFKPFVYLAALENGYTPSTIILDAPIVIDQGPGLPKWKPENYSNRFYGPSTMRLGIEKSRNLMTVRLAQTVGMEKVAEMAERFGVVDRMPMKLSMALGAGETTLLRLTTAYAMIVNGGKRIEPTLIDRVQDRRGNTIFRHDTRPCEGCQVWTWLSQSPPQIPDTREQIIDAGTAYQMVSMLQGAVERGTGVRVSTVGKPLAGKTGTTDESRDTWFVGFSPDLAVGVYVGFDTPRSLGAHEQGASVAAPIFRDFMAAALRGKPGIPFRIPPGIRLVRVDANTGQRAGPNTQNVILEAFKPGTEPTGQSVVIEGHGESPTAATGRSGSTPTGLGGLY